MARTRLVNKVRQILRRHNLQWEMPTKKSPTQAAIAWLEKLVLPEIDRLEMDHLLADLKQVQKRIEDLETVIAQRCGNSDDAVLLATIPGGGTPAGYSRVPSSGRDSCLGHPTKSSGPR